MNMKKTMAAIAAASVAVSAMATTASAELADKTLTYNLAREATASENAGVTISANFQNVNTEGASKLYIKVYGAHTDDVIEISGYYNDQGGVNRKIEKINVTGNKYAEGFSQEGFELQGTFKDDVGSGVLVSIDVVPEKAGTATSFVQSKQTTINVVAKYSHLNAKTFDGIGAINAALGNDHDGKPQLGIRVEVPDGKNVEHDGSIQWVPKKVDGEVVSKAKVDELKGSPILKTITKDQAGEYTYSSTSSETTQDVQVGGVSAVGAGKFVIDATSDIPASLNDKTFTWKVNKATVDVVDVKVVTPTDFDKWEGTGVDKEFVYGVSASACASVSNATVAATLGATADIDAIAALDEDGDGVITFSTTDTGANWKADNTAQTSYAVAALKTLLGDSTIAASNTNASFTVTLTYAWLDATTKAASDPADIDVLVVSQAPITYGATITAHPATAAPEADGTYSWPGNVTYPATIALAEAVGLTDGTKITIKANTTTTNGSWTKVANGVTTPNATLPDFIYNMTKEDFTDGDKIIITAATVDESDLKGYTSKIAGLATGYTGGSFRRYPYMSNLNTSGVMSLSYGWTTYYNYNATDRFNLYANGGDIITYLEGQAVNSGATATNKDWFKNNKQLSGNFGSYTNVGAVLNDAVQNYDVTFTFNTATQGVNVCYYDASTPTWGATADWNNNMYGMYDSDTWKAWVSTEYMAFGQHLYPLYDFELSQFVGMDWAGVNLFAGALVINGGLTMSLSNTEYFDWTKTSISFSWDDIVDAAAEKGITNDYALTIQTMGLVTSQTWFWDSMDVVLAVRSEDDASADAGIDSDDDVIEDEDIDEGDDIDVEPEDVEPEPEPEPEPEAAPVEATSPKTGNASVALAVIPVALAAAAVVAKKRG